MDSEARVVKLEEWFLLKNVRVEIANERPWGSYNPAISFDGQTFAVIGRTFGWGFTPLNAAAIAIEEAITNNATDIINWLGEERMNEIKDWWKSELIDSGSVN